MHYYPVNYNPSDTSNSGWNSLGFCSIYYNLNKINNQPTPYGQLINIPADSDVESAQLWVEQSSGNIYSRSGNSNISIDAAPFKRYATSDEVAAYEKEEGKGNNWIRYKSGLQLCWTNSIGTEWWNFPVAFSSTPVVVFTDTNKQWPWVSDISNTGCKHNSVGTGNGFAIGWWK
jgi:hypothetical protein